MFVIHAAEIHVQEAQVRHTVCHGLDQLALIGHPGMGEIHLAVAQLEALPVEGEVVEHLHVRSRFTQGGQLRPGDATVLGRSLAQLHRAQRGHVRRPAEPGAQGIGIGGGEIEGSRVKPGLLPVHREAVDKGHIRAQGLKLTQLLRL